MKERGLWRKEENVLYDALNTFYVKEGNFFI